MVDKDQEIKKPNNHTFNSITKSVRWILYTLLSAILNLKPGVINISVSPVQELIFPDLAAVSISLNAVVPTGIIRPPSDFVLAISDAAILLTSPHSECIL